MIYQFIDENKAIFGLRWLFRHFNMAPNAYYNYLKDNEAGYRKQKQNYWLPWNEKPGAGLILHSDQGCQFTSWTFVDFCKSQGIIQSMSKAGCPYDNAPMERFYKTFKDELVHRYHFMNAKALDDAVAQYVFVLYNHVRPHSYNNWMTPFEARNK